MAPESREKIWDWFRTGLKLADVLKIGSMFFIAFKIGIAWQVGSVMVNNASNDITIIKQDVRQIKDDRVLLKNDIKLLQDSLSSYQQDRKFFYTEMQNDYVQKTKNKHGIFIH